MAWQWRGRCDTFGHLEEIDWIQDRLLLYVHRSPMKGIVVFSGSYPSSSNAIATHPIRIYDLRSTGKFPASVHIGDQ